MRPRTCNWRIGLTISYMIHGVAPTLTATYQTLPYLNKTGTLVSVERGDYSVERLVQQWYSLLRRESRMILDSD